MGRWARGRLHAFIPAVQGEGELAFWGWCAGAGAWVGRDVVGADLDPPHHAHGYRQASRRIPIHGSGSERRARSMVTKGQAKRGDQRRESSQIRHVGRVLVRCVRVQPDQTASSDPPFSRTLIG
jgi:hypothetical protein